MGELDNKVAVITGAGSGMAKASVRVFAREGAKVVAADISGAEQDTALEVGGDVLAVHGRWSSSAGAPHPVSGAARRCVRERTQTAGGAHPRSTTDALPQSEPRRPRWRLR